MLNLINIREEAANLLGLNKMDALAFSKEYFEKNLPDLSIDPNANISGISPNNYMSEIAKPYAKMYFLRKLEEKGKEMFDGDFTLDYLFDGSLYMHDATKLQPYCWGASITDIALFGRPYSTLPAKPPKRLDSLMHQSTEYAMDLSQDFAGAIAFTDLVPWMAWFIEKETGHFVDVIYDDVGNYTTKSGYAKYEDKEIENVFQSFVHVLNNSFRVGGDSPFTNISINSKMVYYDIFKDYVFPDGKTIDDLWTTIKRVQKIIIDFMGKGRPDGLPYKFPILTANFKSDLKELDSQWFRYVTEHNHKGFMNMNFAERFALCCRLQLDWDIKQNSFGGGGVKVGSMRVVNINLPQLAYKAKGNEFTFMSLLDTHILAAVDYLKVYREIFKDLIDVGYLKFFKEPVEWFNINMFFATVGFCGIWDAAEIMFPQGYLPNEATKLKIGESVSINYNGLLLDKRVAFMERVVDMLVEETKSYSNDTLKFNVEEVPSESAAGTMAKFNIPYGETKEYYSNQFIPLNVDIPIHERIKIESRLQSRLTGGGMTFLNFDAPLTPNQSYEMHKYMMEEGFVGQFCINYGYTQCPVCHTTEVGKHESVCECKVKPDFYTRVVGYLAKQDDTSKSRSSEIDERVYYKV